MDQIVDPRSRAQMEYSAQFFGFSPDSFIDTILGDCAEIVSGNLQANYQLFPRIVEYIKDGPFPGNSVTLSSGPTHHHHLTIKTFLCFELEQI